MTFKGVLRLRSFNIEDVKITMTRSPSVQRQHWNESGGMSVQCLPGLFSTWPRPGDWWSVMHRSRRQLSKILHSAGKCWSAGLPQNIIMNSEGSWGCNNEYWPHTPCKHAKSGKLWCLVSGFYGKCITQFPCSFKEIISVKALTWASFENSSRCLFWFRIHCIGVGLILDICQERVCVS